MSDKVRFKQVGERGDNGEVEYEVHRGDVLLGTVERYAHPSYRSMGRGSRIRGSLQGYSRGWRPLLPLGERPEVHQKCMVMRAWSGSLRLGAFNELGEHARAEAVDLLVAWHDHPELREAPGAD